LSESRDWKGMILDATALIDFQYLEDWDWLNNYYAPLYIAQELLDSDHLEAGTKTTAAEPLTPICMDTEVMFTSFYQFGQEARLLSIGDRSTLAISKHRFLLCASDDGLVVKFCEKYPSFVTLPNQDRN